MTNNPIQQIADHLPDAPIPPMIGVGAIALQMAMQYHDATVIKDGVLYQQMKMEGKNISCLGLDDVFDTAKRIEEHLMGSNERILKLTTEVLIDAVKYGDDLHDEFVNMIKNFIEEEDPSHPEPQDLSEAFGKIDHSLSFTEETLHIFAKACGVDDIELSTFKMALDSHLGEDKSSLLEKIFKVLLQYRTEEK